jgi:hypothetical protein
MDQLNTTRCCPHCQATNTYNIEKILNAAPVSDTQGDPNDPNAVPEYVVLCGQCKREYLFRVETPNAKVNSKQPLSRRLPAGEVLQRSEFSAQYTAWEIGSLENIESAARTLAGVSAAMIGLLFASSALAAQSGSLSHWSIKFWGLFFLAGQTASLFFSLGAIWPQPPSAANHDPATLRTNLYKTAERKRQLLYGALLAFGFSILLLSLAAGFILISE